ncbi:MAG: peptidoglycan-binding domain-containing protein [Acetobacteraceae bacterium]
MSMMSRVGRFCAVGVLAPSLLLAGCAQTPLGPTVRVMPGPGKSFDAFQTEMGGCKQFAAQQVAGQADAANTRAVGAAALSTVLGVGLGAAIGGGRGAGIGAAGGALSGAAIGANSSSIEQLGIQQQYDNAFSQCMYAKGNLVPGFTPMMVAMPGRGTGGGDPALVRAVQVELVRLDYLKDPPDGVSGPRTVGAIRDFERANGLPTSGAATNRLLARLRSSSGPASTLGSETASVPATVSPAEMPPPVSATVVGTPATSGDLVGKATPVSSGGWVDPPKELNP